MPTLLLRGFSLSSLLRFIAFPCFLFSFYVFYDDILNFKTIAVQVNDQVIYYFINPDNAFASFVDCYEPTVMGKMTFP